MISDPTNWGYIRQGGASWRSLFLCVAILLLFWGGGGLLHHHFLAIGMRLCMVTGDNRLKSWAQKYRGPSRGGRVMPFGPIRLEFFT